MKVVEKHAFISAPKKVTHKETMIVAREGTCTVGLHFICHKAKYFSRGWVRTIEMLGGGPRDIAIYFGTEFAGETSDGIITLQSFTPQARALLNQRGKIDPRLPDDLRKGLFDLSPIEHIYFVARDWERGWDRDSDEPRRQNVFVEQTWVQLFEATGTDDAHFSPLPCLRPFNLLAADRSATICQTVKIAS